MHLFAQAREEAGGAHSQTRATWTSFTIAAIESRERIAAANKGSVNG